MKEFYDRVAKCAPATREVLDFLQTAAKHAGADVALPTFDGDGVGISYRRGRKRYCRFDPKHEAHHVWAEIPGADRKALRDAGMVSDREDGPWVTIENMRGAVRLVPFIVRAYESAAEP
jgi:hypothetical protein